MKNKKMAIGLCVLATLLVVGLFLFFKPMNNLEKPIIGQEGSDDPVETENIALNDDDLDYLDGVAGSDMPLVGNTDNIVNILLIGQDTRTEKDGLSDSMILCTINKEKKTLVMTSFMRDMLVKIYHDDGSGYVHNRINVTYLWGGMPKLNKCLKDNFGVEVDHNIEVDFAAFKDIVDILGGVDITLTALEAAHVRDNAGIPSNVQEGENHLNGAEALAYARIRKIDSDFHRTERQRTVMLEVFEKCKSMGLSEALELVKVVVPMVATDMSPADIAGYAADILPILSELTVTTQRIPVDGAWHSADAGTAEQPMYVLIPHLEENCQFLRETLGE